MASGPITSWQMDGGKMETVTHVIFLGFKITGDGDCSHEIKMLAPWKKRYCKPGSDGKASVYNEGGLGSIPGLGRSPREGNGNPLQYSCLENPMDRGAWRAAVYGVAKSWIRLSN